jgi:sugar phosphate isomerase/epimerase
MNGMRISTATAIDGFAKIGDCKKIVKLLKDAGFDAYDCTMCTNPTAAALKEDNYLEWAQDLRAYADSIGIECNQSHAPFPAAKCGDEEYNKAQFPKLVRALEVSGILGAKVCVIHPVYGYTLKENVEFYKRLEPYARKAGVKIGLENLIHRESDGTIVCGACSPHDDFKNTLDSLPADVFTACLDTGHAEILGDVTSTVQMIETLGDRLTAMHLQDVDKRHDSHFLPFFLNVEYQPIIEALRKIGYKGDITLEAVHFAKNIPVELLPSLARLMADVATYFRKEIQK